MGTEFAPPPDVPPSVPPANRSGLGFLLAVGVALIVTALAVGGLVAMGAFDTPAADAPPRHRRRHHADADPCCRRCPRS